MSNRENGKSKLVMVTGASGAGRSTAVRALEDIGYEAIDNLPLSLFPRLLEGGPPERPLALGIDVRNRDFSVDHLLEALDVAARVTGEELDLLFLDCSVDVLIRRYSETRRPHPLSPDANPGSGIEREVELLAPIRERANVLIDTTELTPHDLRAEIEGWFASEDTARLNVSVQSFSYKRGIPRGVDLVFDVRFLANPHWEPALRAMSGLDAQVADYVSNDPRYGEFFQRTRDLALFLLPEYQSEGKSHVSIAFGCTGGQHRSVTLAERLAISLEEAGWQVSIRHREMERRGVPVVRPASAKDEGST